jgi:hypothetical protein
MVIKFYAATLQLLRSLAGEHMSPLLAPINPSR